MIRFEAKTPRRLGLAAIKAVMMFQPGVATPPANLSETAFFRIDIGPLMSDSDWAPSSGTLTLRSCPDLRAPASTICQKADVVSLTMIGMVGFSAAGAVWIIPAKAVTPTKLTATRQPVNELKSFIGGNFRC